MADIGVLNNAVPRQLYQSDGATAKPLPCRQMFACNNADMRYLVRGRVKTGREQALLEAIEQGTLGRGSVAGEEYLRNMQDARSFEDGTARWVEVCYCNVPLEEERPYWEEYFDLVKIQDAHARANCRDENGTDPWACSECDCTERLESRLAEQGPAFLPILKSKIATENAEGTEKKFR
jgi:hypothetical protein